jgi:hypothetical protein
MGRGIKWLEGAWEAVGLGVHVCRNVLHTCALLPAKFSARR